MAGRGNMSDRELERRLRALRAEQELKIAQFGFTMIGVFGDAEHPSFTYTLGRHPAPELILIGCPFEVGASLVGDTVRLLNADPMLGPGSLLHEVANLPLRLDATDPEKAGGYAFAAVTRARSKKAGAAARLPITFWQIVMPDSQGRFPDEVGYDLDPRIQPSLA